MSNSRAIIHNSALDYHIVTPRRLAELIDEPTGVLLQSMVKVIHAPDSMLADIKKTGKEPIFVFHGFTSSGERLREGMHHLLANKLGKECHRFKVYYVNWETGVHHKLLDAFTGELKQVTLATRSAQLMGLYMLMLLSQPEMASLKTHFIGHSMGGHVLEFLMSVGHSFKPSTLAFINAHNSYDAMVNSGESHYLNLPGHKVATAFNIPGDRVLRYSYSFAGIVKDSVGLVSAEESRRNEDKVDVVILPRPDDETTGVFDWLWDNFKMWSDSRHDSYKDRLCIDRIGADILRESITAVPVHTHHQIKSHVAATQPLPDANKNNANRRAAPVS